jgi:DNA (cytosine-5)-methyltransferase 1
MKKTIKVGSDFSGVGAFDYAIKRVSENKNFDVETIFACDWDKYARITYQAAHGTPKYYPKDVYEREIPTESLDVYISTCPCQSFSLAGKRQGKNDDKGRGILFFNSYEFIQKNNPRFFIFENVKGLLSEDSGKTFSEWINMLGGKSVNGVPVLLPYEESVPYHLYWKVLNAKHHGVPQNRERVFLIGIRDDQDNKFQFPKEEHLTKRLKDVLEDSVDDKYYLSEKMVKGFLKHNENHEEKGTGFIFSPKDGEDVANCLRANAAVCATDNTLKVGYINQDTQASAVYDKNGLAQTMTAGTHGYAMGYVQVKSAALKGYEEAKEGDSINFSVPNSETRRGRVDKGVSQTLDTAVNQGVMIGTWRTHKDGQGFRKIEDGNCPTITARAREDGSGQPVILVSKEVRTEESKKKRKETGTNDFRGKEIEFREQDSMNTITTSLTNDHYLKSDYKIRRLTPIEAFRLMHFPDEIVHKAREQGMSDSQLYKQAGNSVVVRVLEKILDKLPL